MRLLPLSGSLSILMVLSACSHNAASGEIVFSPKWGMRGVELHNMLPRAERGEPEDRVSVLSLEFSRRGDGAVERVDVVCDAGGVELKARPIRYAPGDRQYSAYMYTSREASKRLVEGPQKVRCRIQLDDRMASIEGRVHLFGAPLGTPFEVAATPILAIDCETGAAPQAGRPMCVQFRVRNQAMRASDPKQPVTVACEIAGQRVTETSTLAYLGDRSFLHRFEQAPAAGAHDASCWLVEHPKVRAQHTIKVGGPSAFGVELVRAGSIQHRVFACHESPDCPRTFWHTTVRLRVKGDAPAWTVSVSCVDPSSSRKLTGYHQAWYALPFDEKQTNPRPLPLMPGSEISVSVQTDVNFGSPNVGKIPPSKLECTASVNAREGGRLLAQTAKKQFRVKAAPVTAP